MGESPCSASTMDRLNDAGLEFAHTLEPVKLLGNTFEPVKLLRNDARLEFTPVLGGP